MFITPDFAYLHEPKTGGTFVAAMLTRIHEARGDFLAFLDQDDLWLPGKIDAQMALLLGDPTKETARAAESDAIAGAQTASYGAVSQFAAAVRGQGMDWVMGPLGAPGADGRRAFSTIAGSDFDIPCGLVIAAVGQK